MKRILLLASVVLPWYASSCSELYARERAHEPVAPVEQPAAARKARNVVLMIGDGMGAEHVWAAWPLHYYPLYLPEDYLAGEKLYTFQYAPSPVTTPGELTEEEQQYLEQLIEADLLSMDFYSSDPQQRNAITFAESGRKNFRYDFESETNEVFEKVIGSRTVQIVKAGSSYRCFWQQDDHILLLSTTGIPLDEVEKIIANVERIR